MKAIGYTSLNEFSQRPKNLALSEQNKIIREYVRARNWELVNIYQDTISSSASSEMPQNQPALERIVADSGNRKFDVLIVARLDRLTRNIRRLDHILSTVCVQNGVALVSAEEELDTSTTSGKQVLRIINIVTKWDNKRISDRTREIIARKKAKGEPVGHAPFGYTYENKRLVGVKRELEVVAMIRQKRTKGMSYHKIADYLNSAGIASKRGKVWYAETVKTAYNYAPSTDWPIPSGVWVPPPPPQTDL